MNLNFRTLKAFIELADVKKFTLAADRCHMTQSALSQAIAKLEADYGVALFHRSTRSVELTPEGNRFLASAKEIMSELEMLSQDLQSSRVLSQGKFSLAIVPSLASYWLPGILRAFLGQFPGVRIRIIDGTSARCHELVQQGIVDFSLSSQPGNASEFKSNALFDEALHVALEANHPLRDHKQLSAKDLKGVAFIHQQGLDMMLLRAGKTQLPARQWLKQLGTVDVDVEVENLATLAGLVEAGFGACITPACSLPLFSNRGVVTVPIDPKVVVRTIYSCHRLDKTPSIAASQFLSMLQTESAEV